MTLADIAGSCFWPKAVACGLSSPQRMTLQA
jgi:hypothetical protein